MPIQIAYKDDHCEWIDVELPTPDDFQILHTKYGIDTLLLEDTVDPNHLPKFEQAGNVKFFLMRESTELERKTLNSISDVSTKVSLFLVNHSVITVHRIKNHSIYEMKNEVGSLDKPNVETIALAIALKVMRSFDDEAKNILEKLDKLEDEIFMKNTSNSGQIRRLYKLKRKTGLNIRILNMSTDWVNQFRQLDLSESAITDLKDKHQDVIADFDHLNAQVTNLISMFLALTDQKANQVMKLLAIYSVYFLPITFIAGLYGMNFENMPELHTKYGYFATLGFMLLIVISTFIYFRRKKW